MRDGKQLHGLIFRRRSVDDEGDSNRFGDDEGGQHQQEGAAVYRKSAQRPDRAHKRVTFGNNMYPSLRTVRINSACTRSLSLRLNLLI